MKNLVQLRKQNKISQNKLGKDIGLATNTICQYENGRRIPDIKTLILIADYFGVSCDYLLDRQSPSISENRQQLLDKIYTLSEEQVSAVIAIINQMK